MNLHSDTDISL